MKELSKIKKLNKIDKILPNINVPSRNSDEARNIRDPADLFEHLRSQFVTLDIKRYKY